jgi:hypothetical protein
MTINKKQSDIIISIVIFLIIIGIVFYIKTSFLKPKAPTILYKTKVEIINQKIEEYEIEIKKLNTINDSLNNIINKRDKSIFVLKQKRDNIKIDSIKTDEELMFAINYLKNIK